MSRTLNPLAGCPAYSYRKRRRAIFCASCISVLALASALAGMAAAQPIDLTVSDIIASHPEHITSIPGTDPVSGQPGFLIIAPYVSNPPGDEASYSNNKITVNSPNNPSNPYAVYGSMSDEYDIFNNNLVVRPGFNLYSSYAAVGTAFAGISLAEGHTVSGNVMDVSDGGFGDTAGGGYAEGGNVSYNAVNAVSSMVVLRAESEIIGGLSRYGGVLENNNVTFGTRGITSRFQAEYVVGAYASNSRAYGNLESRITGNKVETFVREQFVGFDISVTHDVAGAIIHGAPATPGGMVTEISGNEVSLYSGTFGGSVYGANVGLKILYQDLPNNKVDGADISSNKVTIIGVVKIRDSIYGASASDSSSSGSNTFSFNSVTVEGRLAHESYSPVQNIIGSAGVSGTAVFNFVTVDVIGISPGFIVEKDVAGATMAGTAGAYGNTVDLRADEDHWLEIQGTVAGARVAEGSASAAGPDSPNGVSLRGRVTVGGDVFGASAGKGSADGNLVLAQGLSGTELVSVGGRLAGGFVGLGDSDASSASGNAVSLRDVRLGGSVYGGLVGSGTGGRATGNTVRLSGTVMVDGTGVDLAGGHVSGSGTQTGFSGNALLVDADFVQEGSAFRDVSGFETILFTLGSERLLSPAALSDPLLDVSGTLRLTDGTSNSTVRLVMTDETLLPQGTRVLVSRPADVAVTASAPPVSVVVETRGLGLVRYETPLSFEGGSLVMTVALGLKEESKAFSEVPLAGLSFVSLGGDLMAGRGIPAALAASRHSPSSQSSPSSQPGAAPFAVMSYGRYTVETGSHVDVKGTSGAAGVAFVSGTSAGPLAAGLFVEFGEGSFDSYNEFLGLPPVHGEGNLSYVGGGAFARMDFGPPESSRPYLEASVRYGRTRAEFRSPDIRGPQGMTAEYGYGAGYLGFHAGGGYVLAFGDVGGVDAGSRLPSGTLDLSLRYFHVRMEGHEFELFGRTARLDPVTSSRIRFGGRLSLVLAPSVRPYFGSYVEHEFAGVSRGTYAGIPLPSASLGGTSGVFELGVAAGSPGNPLEIQLGVQGSTGRREGISASLSVTYVF